MCSSVAKWAALPPLPFSPLCLLPHSYRSASTTARGIISWTRLGRSALKSNQTNKKKDKSLFIWRFSFCPGLYQGSETQSVPQTIAAPPSRRQQTAAEGQQLGQGSAEKLPKAVLSAKITFNCPSNLSLDSELQQGLIPKLIFIPSLCHCTFIHAYICI